jgi:hypothetical protein
MTPLGIAWTPGYNVHSAFDPGVQLLGRFQKGQAAAQ